MVLIKIAARTKRIRVGTAVLVVPLHDPRLLAEQVAMADVLTEGRLEVGLGRGYQPYEFERFGQSLEASRDRMEEGLDVFTRLLAGGPVSHHGKVWSFPETQIFPHPIQRPLPLWLAAHSRETVVSAVRRGMHVMSGSGLPGQMVPFRTIMDETARECGWTTRPILSSMQYCHVAESDEQARKLVRALRWHSDVAESLAGGTARVEAGGRVVPVLGKDRVDDDTYFRSALIGSAETVVARIRERHAAMNFQRLHLAFWAFDMRVSDVLASMERFVRHVKPAVEGLGE
jgi:alkanesulfonate monooxygenase SsuD/methylene tetrahydromethanopterin reductase-like flavin-dependent oxidoreductase (luciferase family)